MAMNDEHATQQNQPARQPGQAAGQQPVSLDDYFDQLDAAFSNLQQPGSAAAQHDTMRAEEDWMDRAGRLPAAPFEPLITPPARARASERPPAGSAPPPPSARRLPRPQPGLFHHRPPPVVARPAPALGRCRPWRRCQCPPPPPVQPPPPASAADDGAAAAASPPPQRRRPPPPIRSRNCRRPRQKPPLVRLRPSSPTK